MSNERVQAIAKIARRTAVEVVWAQWSALTSAAAPVGGRRARSIVDPEALVLMSLALRRDEPRLFDLVAGWAERAAPLLSVQRMISLAAAYPEDARQALGEFAALAAAAGDKRWRRHAVELGRSSGARRHKDLGPIRLLDGPALMLRLRAGFGVGAKADLLGFLLGLHDGGAILRTIALATGYTTRAVRSAVDDMHLAGLITRVEGPPPTFYVAYRLWIPVLAAHSLRAKSDPIRIVPAWRYWAAIFGFLAKVVHAADEARAANWTPYIASSRARDLVETYEVPFKRARLPLPVATGARGADYLDEFESLMHAMEKWVGESM